MHWEILCSLFRSNSVLSWLLYFSYYLWLVKRVSSVLFGSELLKVFDICFMSLLYSALWNKTCRSFKAVSLMYSLSISCTCLHLSVSDRASHGTLLVDIEGKKKKCVDFMYLFCICFQILFRRNYLSYIPKSEFIKSPRRKTHTR